MAPLWRTPTRDDGTHPRAGGVVEAVRSNLEPSINQIHARPPLSAPKITGVAYARCRYRPAPGAPQYATQSLGRLREDPQNTCLDRP